MATGGVAAWEVGPCDPYVTALVQLGGGALATTPREWAPLLRSDLGRAHISPVISLAELLLLLLQSKYLPPSLEALPQALAEDGGGGGRVEGGTSVLPAGVLVRAIATQLGVVHLGVSEAREATGLQLRGEGIRRAPREVRRGEARRGEAR